MIDQYMHKGVEKWPFFFASQFIILMSYKIFNGIAKNFKNFYQVYFIYELW